VKVVPPHEPQPIMSALIAESDPAPIQADASGGGSAVPPRSQPVRSMVPASATTVRPVENTVPPREQPAPQAEASFATRPADSRPADDDRVLTTAGTAPAAAPLSVSAPPPVAADAAALPVAEARFDADYLRNPAPEYPPLSRKRREQGLVLLRVRVDVSGRAMVVELKQSCGFERLDQRALETVSGWRFVPASAGGKPVEAWVVVPIQFSLKG
jgi:protein TonB